MSMAVFALAWRGPGNRFRASLRWGVLLAGVGLLGATLPAPGLEGIHRWLALGPVRIHAGALLLPPLLVVLLEIPWVAAGVGGPLVLVVLLLQPDAAQAAAFCAAWIGIVAVRRERGGQRR